jgi:hypothetical protein
MTDVLLAKIWRGNQGGGHELYRLRKSLFMLAGGPPGSRSMFAEARAVFNQPWPMSRFKQLAQLHFFWKSGAFGFSVRV